MQGQALPGFREFYPEETAFRTYIFATWRDIARRYGFQEYDGPPLEPLELYTEKSGDEIVQQLYSFEDKGHRSVALRPEMTPTLARMVGARAVAVKKPIRWFSIPQLFRYERQQRGRLREHFQLNMDIIGEASPAADAEVMAAAVDILRAFGLGSDAVRLRVSDRRILSGELTAQYGVRESEIGKVLSAFDKWNKAPQETQRQLHEMLPHDQARAILNFLSGLRDRDTARLTLLKSPYADALNECVSRLQAMELGEFVEIDFQIVRGLAYYTGVVFEAFDAKRSFRAICGGGRYDKLIEQISGVDLPCVGFGMGDVVLKELLVEHEIHPTAPTELDAFLVAASGEDIPHVLRLAHELRERGLAVEYALRHQAIGKQLELAAARGAPRAVIIRPEERKMKLAIVRNLRTGKQKRIHLKKVKTGAFS